MEVGAVKQAFNNEVIHLKKNLNQAKIHTIHKLTRKAKTFNGKKAPDKLKEKLKRKAESAVNEVLIIKKIKPRDIARFIVTHKGNLNDYLNKPEIDQNKACARLLLHKALHEKYKTIQDRFGNISINDLLMSRHERRKLKKEMREKQMEKKKGKGKTDSSKKTQSDKDVDMNDKDIGNDDEEIDSIINNKNDSSEMSDASENESSEDVANDPIQSDHESNSDNEEVNNDINSDHSDEDKDEFEVGKFVRATPIKDGDDAKPIVKVDKQPRVLEKKNKKPDKRKDNKNKNMNEKILKRNFNKKVDDVPEAVKVVDPFFKTSSGDNYMSLAEPRAPDEVKEVHQEGNRKYRRAVMFGYIPKSKPRKFDQESKFKNTYNGTDRYGKNGETFNQNSETFNKNTNFKSFNNNDRKNKFNDNKIDEKPEKLHPSWEAKKKLSSVLPFQGKKIVFDDS